VSSPRERNVDENLESLRNQFPAVSEYLAQIFFIERDNGIVPNSDLAVRLKVSRPAVSQAVGRLKKLGLVAQERYGTIDLTTKGRALAEKTVKHHFLLEHLLVQALGYPWDKSDAEAANMKASLSDELTAYLLRHFGNPSTCPHGNPMPGSNLEQKYLSAPTLVEAAVGMSVRIIRITEEGELIDGMLSFCQENRLTPGTKVEIVSQSETETVCLHRTDRLAIPMEFSTRIRWQAYD